jgi:hypothetical protein
MRLVRWLVTVAGGVIFLGTLADLNWVSAYGCGMATAGCGGGVSIPMPLGGCRTVCPSGAVFRAGGGGVCGGEMGDAGRLTGE